MGHSDNVVLLFLILGLGLLDGLPALGSVWGLSSSATFSNGGMGGKRSVSVLFRQKEIAGMTGP